MSNRIRILFHCGLDGQTAHVGRQALNILEAYVTGHMPVPTGQYEWVKFTEWMRRGHPTYLDKGLDHEMNVLYKVAKTESRPSNAPSKIPQFLNAVDRAKWFWNHLSPEVRQHCQLIITREGRASRWTRSRTNPVKYGWKKPAKKPSGPSQAQAQTQGQPSAVAGEGPPNIQVPNGNAASGSWYSWDDPIFTENGLNSPPAKANKANKPVGKARYQTKASPATSQGWAPEIAVQQDSVPEPSRPSKPGKPKFRLGIWS